MGTYTDAQSSDGHRNNKIIMDAIKSVFCTAKVNVLILFIIKHHFSPTRSEEIYWPTTKVHVLVLHIHFKMGPKWI
jgi:hypothetical protein